MFNCYYSRSAGEISCDQASQWGEMLPHVLPNVSRSTTRCVEYVCVCVCVCVRDVLTVVGSGWYRPPLIDKIMTTTRIK